MKAKDLMTTLVKTCPPNATLASVAIMMWDGDCGVPSAEEVLKTLQALCAHHSQLVTPEGKNATHVEALAA